MNMPCMSTPSAGTTAGFTSLWSNDITFDVTWRELGWSIG